MSKKEEDYKEKILETVEKISNSKMKLLYEIVAIMGILPVGECERTIGYLMGLYFSWD